MRIVTFLGLATGVAALVACSSSNSRSRGDSETGVADAEEDAVVSSIGRDAHDARATPDSTSVDAIEDTGVEIADTADGDDGLDPDVATGPCGGCERNMRCSAETETCTCFGESCPRGTMCDRSARTCEPAVEGCTDGGDWSGGEPLFEDASDDWNLPSLDARGVRLSAADVNGDGWMDLIVRKGTDDPNAFGQNGSRTVWLLENKRGEGFKDVTKSSNLLARRSESGASKGGRPAQIVVWGDVDNDGDLDAYTGFKHVNSGSGPTSEIMLNQGDGTFELGPEANGVRRANSPNVPSGATFLDYNRDGNLDLWISQYGRRERIAMQDRLYRGNGDGTFDDVTEEMGLKTARWRGSFGLNRSELNEARAHTRSWSSNACDLNDDGTQELLSASYGRAPNHLWRFSAAITPIYKNISIPSGYAFDNRTDWHDNASARCYCKLHPDAPDCKGVPPPTRIPCQNDQDAFRWNHQIDREPFRLGGNSGTTVCADLDTDGQMDLLTTELVHWDVGSSSDPSEILYNHEGSKIRFRRPGNQKTGLTRTHKLRAWNEGDITGGVFDIDNDARPDVYIGSTDYPGTRAHLWHQQPDGTFEHVSPSTGIDHESSHGVAIADFDHDGDLDVVLGHSRIRCNSGNHCYDKSDAHVRFFENKVGQTGNWLQLDLVGAEGTNRAAIGARVEVKTARGTQVQEVDGGHGHYGIQHGTVLHFGLGPACRAEVTVKWPDSNRTIRTLTLETGARYRLEQGQSPTTLDITSRTQSP